MSDTAQDYQKLLSNALQKQILILGPQITLLKARNVTGLSVTDDGQVTGISGDPQKVITQFLEEFRGLSSPLVKKTMQPLLSLVIPTPIQPGQTTQPTEKEQPKPTPAV